MSIQNLFSNARWNKANFRIQFARIMQVFFILVFLTSTIGVNPVAAQDTLQVVSSTPTGTNVPILSIIEIEFNQPILSATFAGSINGQTMIPTQIVVRPGDTQVTVDPGELEYGKTYTVLIAGTVSAATGGATLGNDYSFSFTVMVNPNPKVPTTTVVIPAGQVEVGSTVTISGSASGFVWQRDPDNPLELELYGADGSLIGNSPMLHPTAFYIPQGIDGYKFWLIYTGTGGSVENPILMRSIDGVSFSSDGITNPLFTYNFQPPYDTMNLADPEIYRVGKTWMLFYEQEALSEDVLPYMGTGGNIGLALSTDGANWEPYGGAYTYDPLNPPTDFPANGNPVVRPPTPTSTGYRSGEMAVIFKDGLFHMWRTVIDGGLFIYHDTATDPRGPWTLQPDKVNMGSYEYGPHPDVVYDAARNLFLMLYLIPSGTNVGQLGLYTSSSPSGPWTLHPINPIFSAQSAWEGSRLYRSSMVMVDGQWYMYYSGDTTGNPQIGLAREVAGVRRVEVSTNGGTTWQSAAVNPDGSWSYQWTPAQPGMYTVQARVLDDFMQGSPTTGIDVPISSGPLPAVQAPVLVVKDSSLVSNPYNGYLAEILKAEGLTEFQQVELGALMGDTNPLAFLNQFDVVLLSQSTVNAAARQVLQDYVTGGGSLIAMRPDPALADLFGLTYVNARAEQNLQFFAIEAGSEAGSGIVRGSLQYHGAADNYTLSGGSALAYLWNNIATPSANPAVTLNNVGAGSAVAFTFDLAKSVVMTRQGNPAWKDSEGDTLGGYRPMDMFVRTNGDLWLSGDRMRIPQADEEQRFLANLILTLSEKPLPRMWYLPGDQHTVFVSTGDAEGAGGTALEPIMNDIATYGGHYTSYLMESGISSTTPEIEAGWRAAGHEVGPHVYGGGPDTCAALAPAYAQIAGNILTKFGHPARTARSHTIDWCGWSDMAEIEANNGTELDTNYYHYNNMLLPFGDNANGYFTGTGLPQRFVNEQGTILPIYQATTQFPDEWFADNGKTAAQITTIIEDLIVASENGNYSAFVANIHHVRYDNTPSDPTHVWANQIWAYAQSHDIPLWSAEMLLDFVKARDGSRFDNLTFSNGVLTFDFVPGAARQDLTVMIPASHLGNNLLSVSLDGGNQTIITETVKGLEYARFTAPTAGGHVTATYGQDSASPVISGVQANGISDVAATITWQTDEVASSQVEYGTNPANLNQSITVPGNVLSHVVTLSGLNPLTQYHYRVISIDRAGNPASVSTVYTFTTGMPRWVETSTSDFSDGVLNDTEVTTVVDGEVILGVGSGARDDFPGTTLNTTTWFARNLFGGDPVFSVSDGQVTVSSGTYIRTNQTYFQKTLEGMVTLRSGPNAHFGWANTVNAGDDGIADPNWIIFTSSNGTLSARTRLNDGQGTLEEINTPLAGIALDVPHLYKIVWNTDNSVQFWVDGVLKTTHTRNFTEPFRVYITSNAGQSTSADWVRVLGDYANSGWYESSAFDTGQVTDFDSLTWTGETPAGTTVTFETRTSDDGLAWNEWLPAVTGGTIDNLSGQFIQYRATLSTNNTTVTPRIDEVTITYQPAGADTNPPVVNSVTPTDQASGISIGTNITISFSEPIDTTTFAATINGATAFVTTYQNGNRVAVLNPNADFDPDSLVTVWVSSTVSDRAGNALGSVYEWNFITSAQSTGWVETTTTDFSDGLADKILISNAGDGELRLIPNFDDHFNGSALGSDWVSGMWGGGAYSPTVSDSVVTHGTPGSFVHSTKSFAAGTSVEGRVKFDKGGNTTAGYIYFGLAGTDLVPWALFGTGYTGDQVYASTYNARSGDPVQVGLGNLFGTWHDYKITWKTDRVEYYVDGVLRHTEMVSIPGPLNIYMSESGGTPAGAYVAADWIRVNQYSSIQETVTEFSDDFSGVVLNWTSLENPVLPLVAADYHLAEGKLVHGGVGTSYHPAVPKDVGAVRNFEFEVDADSPHGFWGIAWGLQDNSHYYFAQSYGGTLRVFRLDNWFNNYTQLGNGFSAPVIVGGIPQHIRLVGQNGTYTIYIDGNLIATVTDTTYPMGKVGVVGYGEPPSGFITNFDNAILRGFEATVVPGGSGVYTSDAHDFGSVQIWNGLTWTGQNPTGTSVQFATRSSADNVTWSDWADVDGNVNIASPSNRYLQYRVQLASTDLNLSPVVEEVVVNSSVQPTLYSLTVNRIGSGTIISDPAGIDCGITCSYDFSKNTFVTLTAVPALGSTFAGWSGAGCSSASACVMTMTAAKSVTATFAVSTYNVTFNSQGGSAVSGQSVNFGDLITEPADPTYAGHTFNGWFDAATGGTQWDFDIDTMPALNITLYAMWTVNTYTLTYMAGANGSITGTTPQTVDYGSNGTEVTAVPDPGYHFMSWSDGVLTASRTDENITADLSVTANFTALGVSLQDPHGPLTSWNNTFTWIGLPDADWYLVQVQDAADNNILAKWFTADAAGCAGDLSCTISPDETLNIVNGDYKWRILDYGSYGYGSWSSYTTFNLNAACYTLTTGVLPAGGGTVTASTQNCGGGYIAGTVVQLTALPNSGYVFTAWSGDANRTTNPVSITMDGDKSVTANFTALGVSLISPEGPLTSWDNTFTWTGLAGADWYLVQVQDTADNNILAKWYTAEAANCAGDLSCTISPDETLNIANGDYKWRILDYGSYGYGNWSPYTTFSLNAACYALTTDILPAGGGTVTASMQNCGGGYIAGTVVQLTALPNSGYVFTAWSGDANGTTSPVSITMDGDRTVTAYFTALGADLISPEGPLTSWDNTFSWTGLAGADWYLVQMQDAADNNLLAKWFTAEAANCASDLSCTISPEETLNIANGDYKWRILDYGSYGYGNWSPYTTFSLNAACYTLTTGVLPAGGGMVTASTQNCAGGYIAGTVVQLTALPNSGYVFTAWSGDANGTTNPVSITMDADKTVTANFKMDGLLLISPSGDQWGIWNQTFTWRGLPDADWYLVQVQDASDNNIFVQWYTSEQTACSGGTDCSVVVSELNLAEGGYKWRILDYGAYGYGNWTPFKSFTIHYGLP